MGNIYDLLYLLVVIILARSLAICIDPPISKYNQASAMLCQADYCLLLIVELSTYSTQMDKGEQRALPKPPKSQAK